jgi:hypothetical protein
MLWILNNMETTTDLQDAIPSWTVQGTNWACIVPLDAYNAQFSSIRQAEEAATRAIEQFKGQERGIEFVLHTGEKEIKIGGVLLVYLTGTNSENGFLLFVHEMFGNAGYYADSIAIEKETQKVLDDSIRDSELNSEMTNEERKDVPKNQKPKTKKSSKKKSSEKPKKSTKKPRKKNT